MKTNKLQNQLSILLLFIFIFWRHPLLAQQKENPQELDDRVKTFLESKRSGWRDLNIPESDGQILYDLIIKNHYTKALEIGTSTGRSGIWIAWALSKTGGKLTTIEIDADRHREALENFKKAGLSNIIEAKLADAHLLVKELKGPFDFVFCDADKEWYTNYFIDVYPKLAVGGCYTAHNVSGQNSGRHAGRATDAYYQYVRGLPNMETTVDHSGGGISISIKKSQR